jgi:hypothetical protein
MKKYNILRESTRLIAGRPGVDSGQEQKIFTLSTESRQSLGPTQPPMQMYDGGCTLGVMWQQREADHLPLSSEEVKHCGATATLPHSTSWHDI